ncbi:hypothetical protein KXX36_007385 [Aspergillus fumigatus]|nr:hypothetical protein KXX36_007385 [Aspergillus fumigatus]
MKEFILIQNSIAKVRGDAGIDKAELRVKSGHDNKFRAEVPGAVYTTREATIYTFSWDSQTPDPAN